MDFIRVLLMCFVIGTHAPMKALSSVPVFMTALSTTLFLCDGGFFMVSGYFLLEKELSSWKEYLRYFLKRVITIILPWILLHPLMDLLFNRTLFQAGPLPYVSMQYWNILVHDYEGYLWFLYAYIPIAFFAPFWAKLLHHLSKIELGILAGLTILYLVIGMLYLSAEQPFHFTGHMVVSWTIYFILGYYLRRFEKEIRGVRFLFYGLALGAFVFIVYTAYTKNIHPSSALEMLWYYVFTFGALAFLSQELPIEKVGWLSSLCSFVAKHSFTVYLTHITILLNVTGLLSGLQSRTGIALPIGVQEFLNYVLGVVCCVLFAILLDELVIFRLQGLLRRLLRKWLA